MVCNEHCQRSHTESCDKECFKGYDEDKVKQTFPCIPGCADSIFEARDWLGQQDTPGTDEYSSIHRLRSQFRRLGLGK